ncbi:MAG: DUF2974 domain-containing protein [Atopobiaceae bacterium]|nr:DUF2974 domain-containing protein [Atopobiaceae bacterium]
MARGFANVIDYARDELETFDERDVCCVDSLVFSCLSYLRLPQEAQTASDGDECLPIKDLYRSDWFEELCDRTYDPQSSRELLNAVAANPRFREARIMDYVSRTNEVAEQQFSALTFRLSPNSTFVAFRGTDNTLVGWKEDFNMSFKTAIPSQVAAARYLEHVATKTKGRIWCGGHSKGGNLAVYAGMMCDPSTRARIVRCFSHDGPGFSQKTMTDPRWAGADTLVDKTIPQSSVVGMVFERQEQDFTVVHSRGTGLSQHDPYRWEIEGTHFVKDNRLGAGANLFDSSINAWLSNATDEERERFVDAVFSVIEASGEPTFGNIKANWRTAVPLMTVAASRLDAGDRDLVLQAMGDVARAMLPSLPQKG